GRARIFPCADDFNNVGVFSGDKRIAVKEQIHLDDLDCLLARNVFADENVDLALDEIVHHQFFAGELLVKVENVGDVAVWELQSHHLRSARLGTCRRDWRRRLRRWSWRPDYPRDRWGRTRRLSRGQRCLSRLRDWRNLSKARTGRDKQQNRSMHGFNGGGEDATRCARAGQFPSVLPPARRKVSAELDTTRDLIKNVSKHYVPRSMKNFLQILPIALCGLAGTAFADDFKSMVITSGMSADLPPIHGDQFMVIR